MRRSGIQRLVDVRVAGCGGDEPYLQYAAQRVAFHAQLCTHCRYAADAHGLLQHCGNVLGVQTVWELAQRLGYTGPIELLSMWLCLLGGGTLCTPAAWDLLSSPRAPALACPAGQYIGGGAGALHKVLAFGLLSGLLSCLCGIKGARTCT